MSRELDFELIKYMKNNPYYKDYSMPVRDIQGLIDDYITDNNSVINPFIGEDEYKHISIRYFDNRHVVCRKNISLNKNKITLAIFVRTYIYENKILIYK